jgi:hypothetical protein
VLKTAVFATILCMIRWSLFVLFIPLFGFSLKEKCAQGQKGDYIIYQEGHQYIFLSIYDKCDRSILFEQIHTLDSNENIFENNLPLWIQQGAKGASQWILYEIDLQNGEVLEAFSPLKRGFLHFESDPLLISKMFQINFDMVDENHRKLVPKTKKVWSPPKKNGDKLIEIEKSILLRSYWPKDDSLMSDLRLDLHFDPANHSPFPYMIDVQNRIKPLARFHQVFEGQSIKGVAPYFPRRQPQLQDKIVKKGPFLFTKIYCQKGFIPFELYLHNLTTKKTVPVQFQMDHKNGFYELKIDIPPQIDVNGEYILEGKSLGIHPCRFDSIDIFELN